MHTFFNDAFAAAYAACTGKMLVLEPGELDRCYH